MTNPKPQNINVLGLMSGTSLDGIDAAILQTNGTTIANPGKTLFLPYSKTTRKTLHKLIKTTPQHNPKLLAHAEKTITKRHAKTIKKILKHQKIKPILIGFHGQTIHHNPQSQQTTQIGNPQHLANLTRINVIADFRQNDIKHGGEGAPLAPLYHNALVKRDKIAEPCAIINIGGVANITYIHKNKILAFDTGPGNALLNDWCLQHTGKPLDQNGKLAAIGEAKEKTITEYLQNPYFQKTPPKSLDRNTFSLTPVQNLSPENGAATLTLLTAKTIAAAQNYLPVEPKQWIITGGGRHNPTLIKILQNTLAKPLKTAEEIGWNGDMMEAQAFAYLAARSLANLPISLPSTTGAPKPLTGGKLYKPQ